MTDKQKAIFELQSMLRGIAKTDKDIIPIIPDGIFGEETEEAVKSFQRKYGFEINGAVDFILWEKIRDEYKKALFALSEPVNVIKISREDLPLVLGQKGPLVEKLNSMLRKLAYLHSNFYVVDGDIFTKDTESNVKEFQRIIFYDVSGQVDKYTWNRLAEYYLI